MRGKLVNPETVHYLNKNMIVTLPTDFYFDDDDLETICNVSSKNDNENFNNIDEQVNKL